MYTNKAYVFKSMPKFIMNYIVTISITRYVVSISYNANVYLSTVLKTNVCG